MATIHPIPTRLALGDSYTLEIPVPDLVNEPVRIDIMMASGSTPVPDGQHPEFGLTFLDGSGSSIAPGDPGEIPGVTLNGNELVFDGTTAPEVSLDNLLVELTRESDLGRYRLEISTFPVSVPAAVSLRIVSHASDVTIIGAEGNQPRWFTCVYSILTEIPERPRLFVPAGFGDSSDTSCVLYQETGDAIPFANIGTGGTLTVTGALASGSDFSLPSTTATAQVGQTDRSIAFNFTGTSVGLAEDSLTLTPDPDTEQESSVVTLRAAAGRVEVIFLGDASGSMGWDEDGRPTSEPDRRWDHLMRAVTGFTRSLGGYLPATPGEGIAAGRVKMFVFSDEDVPTSLIEGDGYVDVEAGWGGDDDVDPWFTHPAAQPGGGTALFSSMRALIGPATSNGEFLSGADDVRYNRRFLVALTDGASNTGLSIGDFIENDRNLLESTDVEGTMYAGIKNVHFLGVPYGRAGGADVHRDYLVQVADLGAELHHVFTTDKVLSEGGFAGEVPAGAALQTAFRSALQTTVEGTASEDPLEELSARAPRFSREVLISAVDRRVLFYVYLTRPDQAVDLRVYGPGCESLHGEMSGVAVYRDDYHRILSVDLSEFRQQYPDFAGTWRMVVERYAYEGEEIGVRAPAPSSAEDWRLPFLYDITMKSDLELNVDVLSGEAIAGEPIDLKAKLTLRGLPICHASVSAYFDQPAQGDINWLAGTKVPDDLIERAREELKGLDVTDEQIKAHALGLLQLRFDPQMSSRRVEFEDPSGVGNYRLRLDGTFTPGSYRLRVVALGELDDGTRYRREHFLTVIVVAKPTPQSSTAHIDYTMGDNGQRIATVLVQPKDDHGNLFFTDPVATGLVRVTADAGTWSGPVGNNFDGSFTRVLTFKEGEQPNIDVSVGDVVLIDDQQLPPVEDLDWLDHISCYKEGREAAKGANKHTQPKHILGDVRLDKPQDFLSLGGRGSVSGRFDRKHKAGVPNALWVFTQSDERPKRYRLEVLIGKEWEVVGIGSGTRGFRLPVDQGGHSGRGQHSAQKAGGGKGRGRGPGQGHGKEGHGSGRWGAIREVRVTDLSNDIFTVAGKPSATPGVSLRGIGLLYKGRDRRC